MTPQQQIRELRNKILGEQPNIFIVEAGYGKRINKAETVTGRYEDSPVSTNDLLRMFGKNKNGSDFYAINENGEIIDIIFGEAYGERQLDLTKDIERQDEKTLLDIIKILT